MKIDLRQREAHQRLVNEAYTLMKEQNAPSYSNAQCLYCSPSGKHCAFWPAIKTYDEQMDEGHTALGLINEWRDYLHEWALEIDGRFAFAVQQCHDLNCERDDFFVYFSADLEKLCAAYELEFPGNGGA